LSGLAFRPGASAFLVHQCPVAFKPPWTVERIPGGYVVKDATGQALAYVYGHADMRDAEIAKGLTVDEGATDRPAKLPVLLRRA
jgi:hypothetical protein